MLKRLQQRGDTLIEVLISMTILSAVIVGAYYITNVSLTSNRRSQERGEALLVAQTQLEEMRYATNLNDLYYTDSTPTVPDAATLNDGAFKGGNSVCMIQQTVAPNPNPDLYIDKNGSTLDNNNCVFNSGGCNANGISTGTCTVSTVPPTYQVKMTAKLDTGTFYYLTINIAWVQAGQQVTAPNASISFVYLVMET